MNEIAQRLVKPEQIESELLHIWSELAKEEKTRASLFNLIIFHHLSPRTDYLRTVVQKVIDQFPCRTLFISYDADSKQGYLKTAVSVIAQQDEKIACDVIDIGVAGSDWKRVPYLILPHLIPDLPVYLLWAEDPSHPHPLFHPLTKLATRIIFDSECIVNIGRFAKIVLNLKKTKEVSDLNWVRIEGWRDLIASTFDTPEKIIYLKTSSHISLVYNGIKTKSFCHLHLQSFYLIYWIASSLRIPLKLMKQSNGIFRFQWKKKGVIELQPAKNSELHPGTVISFKLNADHKATIQISRIPQLLHHATIRIATKESCELPHSFVLGKTPAGQSLTRELFLKGTNPHFLKTLHRLAAL